MKHRMASLLGNLCLATLLPLFILLVLIGCSTQSSYDEAVGLIKAKKYDEAKELLQTIPSDDPSTSKAAVGILVCDMGTFYQKGEYEQAYDVLTKTGEEDGKRYYLLNVSPSDSLFAHAATLAHLVAGKAVIKEVSEYIESFEADPEEYGSDSEMMMFSLRSVAEGRSATHREIDYVDEDGQSDSPPYISSIGIPNLPNAEEWKTEVDEIKKEFSGLDEKMNNMTELSYDAAQARIEVENDALVSAMEFSSKPEAVQWLCSGSGIWVQEEPIFAKRMGIYVKIFNVFSINPNSGRGSLTVGTASAETMRDVEQRSRMDTWIISIDRNVVKFAVGSEWSTGEMTRTGENTAVLKGIGKVSRR